MIGNTHYSGRLERAVDRVFDDHAAAKEFYNIFRKYDFYDVADPNNSLTDEQRAQVPPQNQTRYTQFSRAIADMIKYVLGGESGLLTKDVQSIIDKLDTRSAMNATELDTLGSSLSAIPPLVAIKGAMKASSSMTSASMGYSPYNPDMIPPITMGMPGLPAGVANTFKSGFFQANWNFLYDHELTKSQSFYLGSDGLKIGPNLPVSGSNDIKLKKIFGVTGVDRDLNPVGDVQGGLSSDEYEIIRSASTSTDLNSVVVENKLRLSSDQMRNSFNRYVTSALWDAIKNPKNWVNGHWGALAHNSCPEPVKTAVCSYIWSNGMALEVDKTDESALISYLVYMGVNYISGYRYTVSMHPIPNFDRTASGGYVIDLDGNLATGVMEDTDFPGDGIYLVDGVVTDKNIANTYFSLVADIILRSTNLSNGDVVGVELRKRRIDEANLIYKYVGMPIISYGDPVSSLGYDHTPAGLKSRNFDYITSSDFKFTRYGNVGVPGGDGEGGALQTPVQVTANINYGKNANTEALNDNIITFIKSMMDEAGVTSATISSTTRSPVDQVRAMFNNLNNGVEIRYATAGRQVTNQYYTSKKEGKTNSQIKSDMVNKCNEVGPSRVSRHCANFNEKAVFDIAPSSIVPQSKRSSLEAIMRASELSPNGGLSKLLTPADGDPAIHAEITDPDNFQFSTHANAIPPKVLFTVTNPTLLREGGWQAPLSADYIMANNDSVKGGSLIDTAKSLL